ncbi:MAG: hypothetical protein ACREL9_02550 [Gemmatimonadales bacterium]
MRDIKDLVDVAQRAASRAATALRSARVPAPGAWIEKGDHDFVTEADRRGGAEDLLRIVVPLVRSV